MNYKIYCIKDDLNGFMAPIVDSNDASAIRNFAHAMKDTKSIFYTHPSNFTLYRLGDFDNESGYINAENTPVFIENGSNIYHGIYGGNDD